MENTKQPNILLIMCDQLRYDFVGYQNDFIKTPNIDKIAMNGIIFENCYTNSPICAPARISLATGLSPIRNGCMDNESYLSIYQDTYYKRLRDSGYKVGCVGKLDLAKPSKHNGKCGERPVLFSYGFTHPCEIEGKQHAFNSKSDEILGPYAQYLKEIGKLETFIDDSYRDKGDNWVKNNTFISPLEPHEHHDAFIGTKSCEWIENADTEYPWHLFVSFSGPHNPYDPSQCYIDKVCDDLIPDSIVDDFVNKPAYQKHIADMYTKNTSKSDIKRSIKHYIAYIEQIDEQIGNILTTLYESGYSEDTYIMFTSDHGELLADHGFYIKHSAYEASMHIPLCVSGKGISQRRTQAFVELSDVGETICDLSNSRERIQSKPDAKSFTSVLFSDTDVHRDFVVCAETGIHGAYRCIKTPSYKYVQNFNDIDELYDVKNDLKELKNIAKENPDIVKKMRKTLTQSIVDNKWL